MWRGDQRLAPTALPPGKRPGTHCKAGWAPGSVWTGAKNVAPPSPHNRDSILQSLLLLPEDVSHFYHWNKRIPLKYYQTYLITWLFNFIIQTTSVLPVQISPDSHFIVRFNKHQMDQRCTCCTSVVHRTVNVWAASPLTHTNINLFNAILSPTYVI